MNSVVDGIEREVGGAADLGIIWLHGLGADGTDFLPIVDELRLPCGVRFVFPHAPLRPVTVNGGMVMRAWYDIAGFDTDTPEDRAGLAASVEIVRALVAREVDRGMPRQRIVLAGFSQGGAVVLHAGLAAAAPVGGVIGLSTYLPLPELLGAREAVTADVPVLMAHGTADPVIPLALAERSAERLSALGVELSWRTYPMGHEVSRAEIEDISHWLERF